MGPLILTFISVLPMWMFLVGLALVGISLAISNVVVQQIVLESVVSKDTGQALGITIAIAILEVVRKYKPLAPGSS